MAALWGLPLIFLIENNQYGMGTSTARGSAQPEFYRRGDYIPGIWLDGMDVLAVKKGFEYAADYVRTNNKPIFIEASTYRYHGHSMSDPGISYRSREEVKAVQEQRDCIDQTKARLLEAGWATQADLKQITKEVREEVDKNSEFALKSPEPNLEELPTHIYTHPFTPRPVRFGL